MFATLYNTGARVSELIGMRIADLALAPAAAIRIRGKGRKERCVPLWRRTATSYATGLRTGRAHPTNRCSPIAPAPP